LAYDFRLINADAKAGDVFVFREAKLEKIIYRLAGPSSRAIQERDVDRPLGRKVIRGDALEIFHARGEVVERKPRGINALKNAMVESMFSWYRNRRGGFAQTGNSILVDEFRAVRHGKSWRGLRRRSPGCGQSSNDALIANQNRRKLSFTKATESQMARGSNS